MGTRPKKPSSSRGFAHEARGARGSWGLKTENRIFFLSFQDANNYQKKKKKKKVFFFFFERPRPCSRPRGQQTASAGEGGREGMNVSARTRHVRADAQGRPCGRECFIPRLLHNGRYSASKSWTIQPPLSDRPSVRYRPCDNPGGE
jgi:hypothetical protein